MQKLLFLLCYIIYFIALLAYKKKDAAIDLCKYIIIQIFFVMITNVMIVTIPYLFGAKFIPLFIAILYGIIGIYLLYKSVINKKFQKYFFNKYSLIAVLIIVIFGLLISYKLFGKNLYISYNNVDPAVHFYMAQKNLLIGEHTPMYFEETNSSLFIYALSTFTVNPFNYYKLYILFDVFVFILSGLMIYILISSFDDTNKNKIICSIIALCYMLGYSLNSMIFGFLHMSIAVVLICFTTIICHLLWNEKITFKEFVPLISMCSLSISLCYMLFAPVSWILIAGYILLYYKKIGQKIICKKTVVDFLLIFLIPLVLTIKFCYFDYFVANNLDMDNAIHQAGGIYGNFITNFIVFIPVILYGVIVGCKDKKLKDIGYYAIGWIITLILFYILYRLQKISHYYFFKFYYVVWLMAMVTFAMGFLKLAEKRRIIIILYGVLGLMLIFNLKYIHSNKINKYSDIYKFNYEWVSFHDTIGYDTIEGYKYATENILRKKQKISWLTTLELYQRVLWFDAINGIDWNKYSYYKSWEYDGKDFYKILKKNNVKYVGIYKFLKRSYEPYYNIIENAEKVYDNSDVSIYKLNY